MKATIQSRFEFNLHRTRNLVQVYDRISTPPAGQHPGGRRSVLQSDSLRAATIFLHATLEDLLRSIAFWKLPAASADVLNQMGLAGLDPNSRKFSLGDLAPHRGKTINLLIHESVTQHLERSNYNNTTEISNFLQAIAIDVARVNAQYPKLQQLMLRRHQIVHRADRQEVPGTGHHRASSIGKITVERWLEAVETFGQTLLAQL